jgi:hypothetical protein
MSWRGLHKQPTDQTSRQLSDARATLDQNVHHARLHAQTGEGEVTRRVICPTCGGSIEAHFSVFDHAHVAPERPQGPEPPRPRAFAKAIRGWDHMRSLTRELRRPQRHHHRRMR